MWEGSPFVSHDRSGYGSVTISQSDDDRVRFIRQRTPLVTKHFHDVAACMLIVEVSKDRDIIGGFLPVVVVSR